MFDLTSCAQLKMERGLTRHDADVPFKNWHDLNDLEMVKVFAAIEETYGAKVVLRVSGADVDADMVGLLDGSGYTIKSAIDLISEVCKPPIHNYKLMSKVCLRVMACFSRYIGNVHTVAQTYLTNAAAGVAGHGGLESGQTTLLPGPLKCNR